MSVPTKSDKPVLTKEDLKSKNRWRRMVWTAGDVKVKKPRKEK